jgi:hypothetical protein
MLQVIKRPQNPYHALFYDISVSRRFENAIFVLIFLNMVSMGIEHYDQSRAVTFVLEICNALFTTIFSLGEIEWCRARIGGNFKIGPARRRISDDSITFRVETFCPAANFAGLRKSVIFGGPQ